MSTETSVNQRIKLVMKTEKLNFSSMGKLLNTSDSAVGNIIKGRNKPGFDFLSNIIQTFERIDIIWLMTGTGKMLKSENIDYEEKVTSKVKHLEEKLELKNQIIEGLKMQVEDKQKLIDNLQAKSLSEDKTEGRKTA